MKKKMNQIIKAFDFSRVNLGFKIKKKDDYATFLGGTFFLLFFGLTAYLIITYFISFIDRSTFNQISIANTADHAPKLDLFHHKIAFAFGLNINNNFSHPVEEYLTINVKHVTLFKSNNTKRKITLELNKCTHEDFFNLVNDEFDRIQLSNFYCINKQLYNETSLVIKGIFTSEEYSYLEYSVFSLPSAKNNIQEFMSMIYKNDIKLQLYHLESSIMISEYEKPEKLYINNKYISLSYPFVLKYNLDFVNNTFVNDANVLLPSESSFSYYTPIQLATMITFLGDTRLDDEFDDYNLFGRIFIKSSQTTYILKRVYQKFTEFLANATSIASQLLIILMVVIGTYDKFRAEECIIDNVLKYKEKIINKNSNEFKKLQLLFNNPQESYILNNINNEGISNNSNNCSNNIEHSLDLSASFHKMELMQSYKPKPLSSNQRLGNVKSNIQPPNDSNKIIKPITIVYDHIDKKPSQAPVSLMDIFKPSRNKLILSTQIKKIAMTKHKTEIVLHEKTIKYSCCDLIKVCLLKMGFNSNIKAKTMMFNKGKEYFLDNIDIFTYFTKMREIDLIKYFLFNMNEICLINFLAKPSISNVIPDDTAPISCMKNDFNITADNILKVSEAFNNLSKLSQIDNYQNDEKLMKFLKQTSYEIYQLIH